MKENKKSNESQAKQDREIKIGMWICIVIAGINVIYGLYSIIFGSEDRIWVLIFHIVISVGWVCGKNWARVLYLILTGWGVFLFLTFHRGWAWMSTGEFARVFVTLIVYVSFCLLLFSNGCVNAFFASKRKK